MVNQVNYYKKVKYIVLVMYQNSWSTLKNVNLGSFCITDLLRSYKISKILVDLVSGKDLLLYKQFQWSSSLPKMFYQKNVNLWSFCILDLLRSYKIRLILLDLVSGNSDHIRFAQFTVVLVGTSPSERVSELVELNRLYYINSNQLKIYNNLFNNF